MARSHRGLHVFEKEPSAHDGICSRRSTCIGGKDDPPPHFSQVSTPQRQKSCFGIFLPKGAVPVILCIHLIQEIKYLNRSLCSAFLDQPQTDGGSRLHDAP